jgi:hypothetical protein
MTDDKRKAESRFNEQAVKEAVGRMRPELVAASEAAHKAKDAVADGDPDFSCLNGNGDTSQKRSNCRSQKHFLPRKLTLRSLLNAPPQGSMEPALRQEARIPL